MAFDGFGYLEIAEFLNSGDHGFPEESAKRSAISRAYYAAFIFSRQYAVKNLGFVPTNTAEDHGTIRNLFKNSSDEALSDVGNDLHNMRIWRNASDYDDANYPSQFTNTAIVKAGEINSVLS